MGDDSPPTGSSAEQPSQDARAGSYESAGAAENPSFYPQTQTSPNPLTGFSPTAHQQQQYGTLEQPYPAQFNMAQSQGPDRMGPFNMTNIANSLPQPGFRPMHMPSGQQQRFHPQVSQPSIVGAIQMPYSAQAAANAIPNQQYYMAQHPQMAQYYPAPLSPSQPQPNISPRSAMGVYANQAMMNPQQPQQAAGYYYPQQYNQPNQAIPAQMLPVQYAAAVAVAAAQSQVDPRLAQNQAFDQTGIGSLPPEKRHVSVDGRSTVVRGPPRKPRQSGHAIWIGNLPPQTELMKLVHHVCREVAGLESLFLISKSNCAFANFKDEPSCIAAQQRLHDSKFQSVRLVSRLRKSTVEGATGVTAPTGPAATSEAAAAQGGPTAAAVASSERSAPVADQTAASDAQGSQGEPLQQKDRYFILKSLTVEDLESSVRNGVWATQSHNEEALNNAFNSADNVYLVFSANKSGEYFGYARMVSPINEDPAAAIEFAPRAQSASDVDLPKAIPTEATEFAPKGRIIDDSARGTIFWEVERDDAGGAGSDDAGGGGTGEAEDEGGGATVGGENISATGDDASSVQSGNDGVSGGSGENKAWGKPFKLEWLSVNRLPFYRTRGLRNAWNSNREVKIARDGTELEPTVGRKLVALFTRVNSPAPPIAPIVGGGIGGGGVPRPAPGAGGMPMISGFPPAMRAPYRR